MKEEDEIYRKVGTGNAFKVPENYFENLTSEVMSKLPEKETITITKKEPTKWQKMKPLLYMAAMFAGAALIIKVAAIDLDINRSSVLSQSEMIDLDGISDQYMSEAVNGSMLDDYSLYVYLTEPSAE